MLFKGLDYLSESAVRSLLTNPERQLQRGNNALSRTISFGQKREIEVFRQTAVVGLDQSRRRNEKIGDAHFSRTKRGGGEFYFFLF